MGAATVEITSSNFKEMVEKDGILLIDWWAEWCGPCKAFGPIYEAAAAVHKDVVFGKIDTDAQQELAASFEIRGIPTLMAFRDRVLVFAQAGALPAPMLEDVIREVRALDMAQVRKEIIEQEKAVAAEEKKKKDDEPRVKLT
jgi:thioredoxin 1